jgi:hypothetical protein
MQAMAPTGRPLTLAGEKIYRCKWAGMVAIDAKPYLMESEAFDSAGRERLEYPLYPRNYPLGTSCRALERGYVMDPVSISHQLQPRSGENRAREAS